MPLATKQPQTKIDRRKADKAVQFFSRYLTHVKGDLKGQPLVLRPWQRSWIRKLFGRVRQDGRRQYRRSYAEIPRKNGKTTLGAGIALASLFMFREPGNEVWSAAYTKDQARICFNIGKTMVENSPPLMKRCTIYKDSIVLDGEDSSWRTCSREAGVMHGENPNVVIFDELHLQKDSELWDALVSGMGARSQPLVVSITTSGFDRESLCYQEHNYARQVLDGILEDDSLLPIIYAADEEDDWRDLRVWKRANPNFGIAPTEEFAREQIRLAEHSPGRVQSLRRLHLDIWTESVERWLDMQAWDDCAKPLRKKLKGKPCYGGLDLATTRDMTTLILLFPDRHGSYDMKLWAWLPEDAMRERSKRDRVNYQKWVDAGLIRVTPGRQTDYNRVRRDINKLADKGFAIRKLAIDRLFQGAQLSTDLADDGFDVVSFPQTYMAMAAPTLELERLVIDSKIRHDGNPVLRWHIANAVTSQDSSGNRKLDKRKATERIDAAVSAVMALAMCTAEPDAAETNKTMPYMEMDIPAWQ